MSIEEFEKKYKEIERKESTLFKVAMGTIILSLAGIIFAFLVGKNGIVVFGAFKMLITGGFVAYKFDRYWLEKDILVCDYYK